MVGKVKGGLGLLAATGHTDAPHTRGGLTQFAGGGLARRGFLKILGGLGAAAATGALPKVVRGIASESTAPVTRAVVEEAAPMAARHAGSVGVDVLRKMAEDRVIDVLRAGSKPLIEGPLGREIGQYGRLELSDLLRSASERGMDELVNDLGMSEDSARQLVGMVDRLRLENIGGVSGQDIGFNPLEEAINYYEGLQVRPGGSDEFIQRLASEVMPEYSRGSPTSSRIGPTEEVFEELGFKPAVTTTARAAKANLVLDRVYGGGGTWYGPFSTGQAGAVDDVVPYEVYQYIGKGSSKGSDKKRQSHGVARGLDLTPRRLVVGEPTEISLGGYKVGIPPGEYTEGAIYDIMRRKVRDPDMDYVFDVLGHKFEDPTKRQIKGSN